jgi:hypothetical protein
LAKLRVGAGVFFAVLEATHFALPGRHLSSFIPSDAFGPAIGRDFVNTWMGRRSAFSSGPAAWFDFDAYNIMLRKVTGYPDFPDPYWSHPPHLILFVWPLGLLPYLPVYLVCCG